MPDDPDSGASSTISGGTQYGPVFQGRDFRNVDIDLTVQAAAAAPVALAQLPPQVVGFTGRGDELTLITGLLDPDGQTGAVVVSAVAGLAGVGKTALAVQAGHVAVQRGWYRGGVLFIDLHGYDEAPVEPAQGLDALLRALGVAGEHIPPGLDARAGLYRSVLAQSIDPMLVIVDNASFEAQVRPLLPGVGPHRVVVTSRHTLAGLGARLLDVAVLDQPTAVELLNAALRAARPNDERISGNSEAAERLAGICGGLPLALQIVAAVLKADPERRISDLTEDLGVEKERLERLRYDDGSGAAAPSVAAAFGLSYRRLDEISSRTLRLLPVNPGPDVSTKAAAVLVDLPVSEAREVLAGLARAHLIEPAPGVPGRWRMHDLMRLYSQRLSDERAGADARELARERLLRYYLSMAEAADGHLGAHTGTDVPETFTGPIDALTWLDAERPNLVAAVMEAAENGQDQIALRLPSVLGNYFEWRLRWDDYLATTAISVGVARHLGDIEREGKGLIIHAIALAELGRSEEAITTLQQAVGIFRQIGSQPFVGASLNNLGGALRMAGRFDEAIPVFQEAKTIHQQAGDRRRQAISLAGIGGTLVAMRRFDEAIIPLQEAAAIARETGDRRGEGSALNNLGIALMEVGRLEEALTAFQGDLAACQEIGDRHGEALTLANLGVCLRGMRQFEESISALQDAVGIFRETDDSSGEANALDGIEETRALQQA
jgi:tetratricopeptide (TPR) repeat protein